MVDMTLVRPLKVKVIRFDTNLFLIHDFYMLSIVIFALGRTV